MTPLSPLLRKIRRKFAPSDSSPLLRWSVMSSWYFSLRMGGRQGPRDRSKEEKRILEMGPWPQSKCDDVIRKLGDNSYIMKPFKTRAGYVELILALVHSKEHENQMRRRNKNADVETILRRSISIPNIEYLLSGSRYIMQMGARREGVCLPIGNTTDEALTVESPT